MNRYELLNELADELINKKEDVIMSMIKGEFVFTIEKEKDNYSVNIYNYLGEKQLLSFYNDINKAIEKLTKCSFKEIKEFKKWF